MRDRLLSLFIGTILILALAFGSCTRHKPGAAPRPHAEPISRADSTGHAPVGVVVQPPRTLLDKFIGRTPAPVYYPPGTPVVVKGKKNTLTINQVAGNQSNNTSTTGKKATSSTGDGATATTIGKVKAPTALGDSASAIDNTKQGQRGGAGASGPGATATATTLKPGLPWGRIAAGVVGGGFLVWVVFFGGGGVLLALARRKSSSTPQA